MSFKIFRVVGAEFFFVSALTLALVNVSAVTPPPTDRDVEGLVGPVKRVEEEEAEGREEAGRLVERGRRATRSVTYDKRGRMVRRLINFPGREPNEQTFYYEKDTHRYTRHRLPVPAPRIPNAPGAFERITVTVVRYDAAEGALYEEVYNSDEPKARHLTQKYRHVFDAEGRLAESTLFTVDGRPGIRSVYTYEGSGRHPATASHYALSNPTPEVTRYTYTLDQRGNWTKRVADTTLADGAGTRRVRITYRHVSYF